DPEPTEGTDPSQGDLDHDSPRAVSVAAAGTIVFMSATDANVTARNTPTSTWIARSPPGQPIPIPSPIQKRPRLVSMTPTPPLMGFSGTSDSWRATSAPMTVTTTNAAPAAAEARPKRC